MSWRAVLHWNTCRPYSLTSIIHRSRTEPLDVVLWIVVIQVIVWPDSLRYLRNHINWEAHRIISKISLYREAEDTICARLYRTNRWKRERLKLKVELSDSLHSRFRPAEFPGTPCSPFADYEIYRSYVEEITKDVTHLVHTLQIIGMLILSLNYVYNPSACK